MATMFIEISDVICCTRVLKKGKENALFKKEASQSYIA